MRLVGLLLLFASPVVAQTDPFTRADTLRGSPGTPGRAWWDVTFYDLAVSINPADSTIRGRNTITYRLRGPGQSLSARGAVTRRGSQRIASPVVPTREIQIDLMTPLEIDSIVQDGRQLEFRRDGNAWFATTPPRDVPGDIRTLTAYYHGRPQIAKRPPWEGGFGWTTDSLGRPWIVTTDQGMGASVWWPNKDTQADEPDSQRVALTVPRPLINVSNGRLRKVTPNADGTTTYEWFVVNPINNYAIAVAAGHYAHWSETYEGEGGTLTLDFWPLDYHLEAARRQWAQARRSEEHTSELQSPCNLVCRLLLVKKKTVRAPSSRTYKVTFNNKRVYFFTGLRKDAATIRIKAARCAVRPHEMVNPMSISGKSVQN